MSEKLETIIEELLALEEHFAQLKEAIEEPLLDFPESFIQIINSNMLTPIAISRPA